MMRLLRVFVVLFLLVSLIPVPASAKDQMLEKQKRRTEIGAVIRAAYEKSHTSEHVIKALEKKGVKLVSQSAEGDVSIMSSGSSHILFSGPYIFFDDQIQEYTIYYGWNWKKDSLGVYYWYPDVGFCPLGAYCDVGQTDAWGIHIMDETVLQLRSQVLSRYNNYNQWQGESFNAAFNSGNNGAVIEEQDDYTNPYSSPTYDSDHGYMTVWMAPTGVHKSSVQIRGHYAHTWSSTAIDSGSLSNSGISINFSSTEFRWHVQTPVLYFNF